MNQFEIQGFMRIPGVFSPDEVTAMRKEADRLATEEGSVCVRHIRSKSSQFDELAVSERLLQLLPDGFSPVRSILFDKTPDENWPVAWHQDLTITVQKKIEREGYGPWSIKDGAVHVQPPLEVLENMMTIRIHLDDTPKSNGALRVLPGSHKQGKIGSEVMAEHLQGTEVICECRAGDVLLMSPLILHASRKSESPGRRRIVHFEYAMRNCLDEDMTWYEWMPEGVGG